MRVASTDPTRVVSQLEDLQLIADGAGRTVVVDLYVGDRMIARQTWTIGATAVLASAASGATLGDASGVLVRSIGGGRVYYLASKAVVVVTTANGVPIAPGTFWGAVPVGDRPRLQAVPQFTGVASGELAGSATAVQMPDVACSLVKFKALYNNAGRVYIGASGVTKADGTTDTTTGLELSPGEETGWLAVDNLNRFYRIGDNAGDDLTYLALL